MDTLKTYGRDKLLGGELACILIATGNRRFVVTRSRTDSRWSVPQLVRKYAQIRDLKTKLDANPEIVPD